MDWLKHFAKRMAEGLDRKELGKKILVGAVAIGACAGTVWGAASYWTGSGFQPEGADRALRNNQVLFGDERSKEAQSGSDGSDSFWEDETAQDQVSRSQQEAGYLFSPDETTPEATTAGIVTPNADNKNNPGSGQNRPSTGIEITNRPGSNTGTITNPSGGGSSSGSGSAAAPTTPTGPTITGEGTVSNPYQGGAVVTDPGSDKAPPSDLWGGDPIRITDSVQVPLDGGEFLIISEPYFGSAASMYKGQTIDGKTIFASIDAYVLTSDSKTYYWDESCLGNTFRIDSISFDEKNWIDMTGSNTVTIPSGSDVEKIYMKVSYRYKTTDDWISYDGNPVPYILRDSRVFLLNTTVKDESKITQDQLLNIDSSAQNFSVGQKVNLLGQLQTLIMEREGLENLSGSIILKSLFPGWQENGKTVPWRYEVTSGRHVLQAPKSISYDTKNYQIELRRYYLDENYDSDPDDITGIALSYLQTLTYYKGRTNTASDASRHLGTLNVPNYTQAVDFPYTQYLVVDKLSLPSTVLYVNTNGVPDILDDELLYDQGLQVDKAYIVEKGNPRYTAKDGILYNLDGTQMLGVPAGLTALTVPEGVTKVVLPYRTKLKTLTLGTKDASVLPKINYSRLSKDCEILVDKSVLEDLLREQADMLRSSKLYVASTQDPEKAYCIRDDLILRKGGMLHGVLDTEVRWLSTTEQVTGLEPGCLEGLDSLTMIHLPTGGRATTLPNGCFDGAPKLETIVCYSEAQYEAAKAAAPEGVEVILAGAESIDGYRYLVMDDGRVMLLNVPENLTEFDGTVPGKDGKPVTVTAISNDVFSQCENLRWVDLPKETIAIGQNAFRGCTSLEGVLIEANTVMIGKGAFDNCSSLRFIASNAMQCDLRSPDLSLPCSNIYDYSFLFSLDGAQGYNGNWVSFTKEDKVTSFRLVDCGGTRVLYAATGDDLWLALRSGGTVDGNVTLPEKTEVIFDACFQDAAAPTGSFNLNWASLDRMASIGRYAFSRSALGPDVVLPTDLEIKDMAFEKCTALKHITVPGELGEVQLSGQIFTDCTALESATVGQLSYFSALPFGLFNNCANLHQLTFTGAPPRLLQYEQGFQFRFNFNQWYDNELEEENLRITVPDDQKEAYLEQWRYGYTGYMGSTTESDYHALWWSVRSHYGDELTDEEVNEINQQVEAMLLEAENHVRILLGMDQVEAPSHRFQYEVDENGNITLTGAKNVDYVELTDSTIDMPPGWYLDYIGSNAFRESPNLRMVLLPDQLSGIYENAFSGVNATQDDPLNIAITGDSIPGLMFTPGVPFSFGIDDSCIRVMNFEGNFTFEDILKAWILPMTGNDSLDSLVFGAFFDAFEEDAPTQEAVTEIVLQKLFAAEKRLRIILSMDPIEDPADMQGITPEEVDEAVSRLFVSNSSTLNAPEEIKPDETKPEETKPDDTKPDDTKPDDTKPDDTRPDDTRPDETKPDETKPDDTKPDETKPDETKPDETKPDETKPDETKPDETKPDDTKPDETKPDETAPAKSDPQTSDSEESL